MEWVFVVALNILVIILINIVPEGLSQNLLTIALAVADAIAIVYYFTSRGDKKDSK